MITIKEAKNIMIEFEIVRDGDLELLKKEWSMLIQAGKKIYLWSRDVPVKEMIKWCKKHMIDDSPVHEYIWDYLTKDSFNYPKADFVIDIDEKFVERFKRNGIPGNVVEP